MDVAEENFDPTRALDGWRVPQSEGSTELDLPALFGATRRAAVDPEQQARLHKRGIAMSDVEDIEVLAPRPTQALLEAPKSDFVDTVSQAEPQAHTPPQAAEPGPDPRLLTHWKPGAWVAAVRCLLPAGTVLLNTPTGPRVSEHPAQWLLALWPPQRLDAPLLSRWPEQLQLVGKADAHLAVETLLPSLPADASLWLAALDVDWADLAALALRTRQDLPSLQRKALQGLIEAQAVADEAEQRRYASANGVIKRS